MTAVTPPDAHLIIDEHDPALIEAKIISETAKISWLDLQKFYAAGSVLKVAAQADLVKVALALQQDDTAKISRWLASAEIGQPSVEQAQQWYQQQTQLWAVVIAPWVLVQQRD
ncbi:DUF2288 family protein [Arsukibacterium sp.]|uniref:DUF2288 family protein n=1 Tax=Arsukibacterium sp. TaxID=1977258 RepID=UPI002FDB7525